MESTYVFLPWLQRGLSRSITDTDPLIHVPAATGGATVQVGVTLLADGQARTTIPKPVVLLGPGDVVGVERGAIVKTEPRAGIVSFEPNYFPYIEFFEEDFPWRYTPAKAAKGQRLRPWLALLVLEESEFDRKELVTGQVNRPIFINEAFRQTVFPPSDQTWAWAHVQINDNTLDASDPTKRDALIGGVLNLNPNLGSSRLLCPRRLRPNMRYTAFLIPSFEKGRIAGLDGSSAQLKVAGQFEPAWGNQSTFRAGQYPVYYEWEFRTGEADIELLARRIKPQDLIGLDVGKLWMDVSDIGYGTLLEYQGAIDPARPGFMPFQGALRMVDDVTLNLTQQNSATEKAWVSNLAALLNLNTNYRSTDLKTLPGFTENKIWTDQDDPILVPPIYGRWYANKEGSPVLNPPGTPPTVWLEQLNLDPAYRAAAGLGTEVVRQNQEDFVSRARLQFSEARQNLNKDLQLLRFAQEVTQATYEKNFRVADTATDVERNRQIALTQAMHTVVTIQTGATNLAREVSTFKGETAFVQPAFRRLTRTQGPLMKRIGQTDTYRRVVMAVAHDFQKLIPVLPPTPPFQNFDQKLMVAISPDKLRTNGFSVLKPNWPGANVPKVPIAVSRDVFKTALTSVLAAVARRPRAVVVQGVDVKLWSMSIQKKIVPVVSFRKKIAERLPANLQTKVADDGSLSPNTFNPIFTEPTYEYIAELRPELFIPNIDKIAPNSAVLLQANSRFIEAYLAGLNHEMAVELLWRGFPADMNATFFRQFWNVSEQTSSSADTSDILRIRDWKKPLGENGPPGQAKDPLVLVLKADLIKKYQNIVVYAHRAKLIDGVRRPDPDNKATKTPLFLAQMAPDFLLAGFDLTKANVLGAPPADKDGWFFVLAERPGEMHFGLDLSGTNNSSSWNDLNWTELPADVTMLDLNLHKPNVASRKNRANATLHWGKGQSAVANNPTSGNGDAAQMASILQQRPFRVFFHASTLIPK